MGKSAPAPTTSACPLPIHPISCTVNKLAIDHLRRLQDLLGSAQADYDTLAYIVLEGATQVTFSSHKRSITLRIGGDDVGHFNGLLEDAARARILALEKEVAEAHALVISEADERQRAGRSR